MYTSIKQGKKLVELGLNPDTADMLYIYWENYKNKTSGIDEVPTIRDGMPFEKCDVPCWSVGALEDILWKRCFDTDLIIENGGKGKYWIAVGDGEIAYDTSSYTSIIDALYEAIVWLLQNNHLK